MKHQFCLVSIFFAIHFSFSACGEKELTGTSPVPQETNCKDGIDNDGDGLIDCADPDCATDQHCNDPVCGNGVCEVGETAINCPADCGNNDPVCGNGVKEVGEQCDRNDFGGETCVSRGFDYGNLVCTSACRINTANCRFNNDPVCGNGVCEVGETAINCPADCGNNDPVCGNGVKEVGEQCDRNDFGGETCSSYGYNSGTLICSSDCRINMANCYNTTQAEICDNGIDDDGDGFIDCDDADCWDLPACQISYCGNGVCEVGENVNNCPQDCGTNSVCGNGILESGEQCDGNDFGGRTCSFYGYTSGSLSCTNNCSTISTASCYNSNTAYCGNGIKDAGELCDGSDFGGRTCSFYGYTNGSLSCTNNCSTILTASCYNSNTAYCGNGILESGEQCDSNTFPSGLSCASYGFSSGSLSCGTGCTVSTINCYNPNTYYCGNGVLDSGEGCDGNLFGGKTCNAFGFIGGNLSCNYNCTVNTTGCTLAGGEICNNGIDDDADGLVDCADPDCRWHSSCTYLTVRKRIATGLNVTYFGCDGTNNASWEPYQCSGTAIMFNGAVNGRYMFAYNTSTCSPQAILDYGISWEAFEFLTYSNWPNFFGNLACYVGCSVDPETGQQTQANAVCIVDKTNPSHQAERNAYMPSGKWLEVHSGNIASYLYWYY